MLGQTRQTQKKKIYVRVGEPHDALYKDGLRELQDPCVIWRHQCKGGSDGTFFKQHKGHMQLP